ncbi:MAG: glycoside hydrolase family 88 protein [Paludibacter sp.]|jgi:rhamnogalacturonyl hydrolase YesR|nr:glycoside hydrolase family 88 protein [Paludibacter sp.]
MKKLSLSIFFSVIAFGLMAQTTDDAKTIATKVADRIFKNTTYTFVNRQTGETFTNLKNVASNPNISVQSVYNQWHYTNGVTNLAMLELGEKLGDPRFDEYVLKNMNFVFNEGNLEFYKHLFDSTFEASGWRAVQRYSWHMIFRNKRLDDNGPMGASLIEVQKKHPNDNFLNYINTTADHILYAEPRLKDGTIARIWPHENTIWADDAFMAISFLARMGSFTGEDKYFTDAANQILKYTQYLWDKERELYWHCYHTDTKEHGVAHWSRANGWIFMATADLLTLMPDKHPLKQKVIANFRMQANGLALYQGQNGLWHQILDKNDSYEETTGTAMFVFGIARGVKKGWLHPDMIYAANMGFNGLRQKITPEGDVTTVCVGTGIMPSLVFYYTRPVTKNDPMGDGPVLRALVEMIDAPRYTEIGADSQYDKIILKKK